jgi:hypothetical protein
VHHVSRRGGECGFLSVVVNGRLHSSAQRKAMMSIAILLPSYNLIALRFAHQSLGASVPSDHLDTEMMNSVIGCGEY